MVSQSMGGKRSRRTGDLSHLQDADRATLLELWREVTGSPPPKNLSQPILRKAIAYELQCARLGGPKARVLGDLKRIAEGKPARSSPKAQLQPGTRLVREWQGRSFSVEVVEGGFLMEGRHYASLSAIARRITGAHWSGPRFFGLSSRDPGCSSDGLVSTSPSEDI